MYKIKNLGLKTIFGSYFMKFFCFFNKPLQLLNDKKANYNSIILRSIKLSSLLIGCCKKHLALLLTYSK